MNAQPSRPTPEDNLTIVRSFLELAFNRRQPAEAAATYLASAYRQHNPTRHGTAAFIRLAKSYLRVSPALHLTVQLLLADGDVVVAQSLIQRRPNDRGEQVMDTFELANGRIVEHWDVMRELPENATRVASAA